MLLMKHGQPSHQLQQMECLGVMRSETLCCWQMSLSVADFEAGWYHSTMMLVGLAYELELFVDGSPGDVTLAHRQSLPGLLNLG